MELWSGRKQVRTPKKELTSMTKEKLKSDTEESIADYVKEVWGSAKSSLSVSSNDEGSSSCCDRLSAEMGDIIKE